MAVARTSKEANKNVHREQWYGRIQALLRVRDEAMCVADVAAALNAEKSTISARLNEMCTARLIHYAGVKPSKATGIAAKHYRLKEELQASLF